MMRFVEARTPRRTLRACVVLAVIVAGVGRPALGDEILLKGSVRPASGSRVLHLGDIAELRGPHATEYADLVVMELDDPSQLAEISVGQVRAKLTDAGVHWGQVQLSGAKVIVRPRSSSHAGPPLAMTAASLNDSGPSRPAAPAQTDPLASHLVELATLRGAIARMIVSGLRVDPQDLRLIFDRRDDELLDTTPTTKRYEIQPLTSFQSDRIELAVRGWTDGRVQDRRSLRVQPLIHTDTVVLQHDISRGREIAEDDLALQRRWLQPSQAGTMSSLVGAVGRAVLKSLRAGDVLRQKHIRRETLIRRGDLVIVRCLVGGVVISVHAEARADGAKGQTIEFRKLGERATFLAEVAGHAEAVVDLARAARPGDPT